MSDLVLYKMVRENDESGVSGTGHVGWVIDWPNRFVTLGWVTDPGSVATYRDMEAVDQIHGHGGKTHFVQMYRLKDGGQEAS